MAINPSTPEKFRPQTPRAARTMQGIATTLQLLIEMRERAGGPRLRISDLGGEPYARVTSLRPLTYEPYNDSENQPPRLKGVYSILGATATRHLGQDGSVAVEAGIIIEGQNDDTHIIHPDISGLRQLGASLVH